MKRKQFKKNVTESLDIIWKFLGNPFGDRNEVLSDTLLIYIASILSIFTIITRNIALVEYYNDSLFSIITTIVTFILAPLFGLIIVYFKGLLIHLYLKYVASNIFKESIDNENYAKQIATFTTIGLVVSAVPSLSYIGLVINLIIAAVGVNRLFQVSLIKSSAIAILYQAAWWGIIYSIGQGTKWI